MIRSGSITAGSPVVTGLSRTSDLYPGMYAYAAGLASDSTIATVDSATQVTLNRDAVGTATPSIEFTTCSEGVLLDRNHALIDVQTIVHERGGLIRFILRGEADVTRDAYSSIAKREQQDTYFLKAFPIETNPSSKQLERAGILEKADAVIYTAMKDWQDLGIDFHDIEIIRSTVQLMGNTYQIKEKGLSSQYSDTFLYITFGVSKS